MDRLKQISPEDEKKRIEMERAFAKQAMERRQKEQMEREMAEKAKGVSPVVAAPMLPQQQPLAQDKKAAIMPALINMRTQLGVMETQMKTQLDVMATQIKVIEEQLNKP